MNQLPLLLPLFKKLNYSNIVSPSIFLECIPTTAMDLVQHEQTQLYVSSPSLFLRCLYRNLWTMSARISLPRRTTQMAQIYLRQYYMRAPFHEEHYRKIEAIVCSCLCIAMKNDEVEDRPTDFATLSKLFNEKLTNHELQKAELHVLQVLDYRLFVHTASDIFFFLWEKLIQELLNRMNNHLQTHLSLIQHQTYLNECLDLMAFLLSEELLNQMLNAIDLLLLRGCGDAIPSSMCVMSVVRLLTTIIYHHPLHSLFHECFLSVLHWYDRDVWKNIFGSNTKTCVDWMTKTYRTWVKPIWSQCNYQNNSMETFFHDEHHTNNNTLVEKVNIQLFHSTHYMNVFKIWDNTETQLWFKQTKECLQTFSLWLCNRNEKQKHSILLIHEKQKRRVFSPITITNLSPNKARTISQRYEDYLECHEELDDDYPFKRICA